MADEKRVRMGVDVPEGLPEKLRAYCKQRGKIQKDLVARILTRFFEVPDPVKRAWENDVDEGMEEAYAAALEHLAEEVRSPKSRRPVVGYVTKGGKLERTD